MSARDANDVEHLYIYGDSTNSAVISDCIADDLGIPPEPSYRERIIDNVEQIKRKESGTIEFELGIPYYPISKFKMERPA